MCIGYVDNICSSDHKPVFASFDVGVVTQFTSSHGGSVLTADMKIVFHEILVEVCGITSTHLAFSVLLLPSSIS